MKSLLLILFLSFSCTREANLPYKAGWCYREKLKFMASGSPRMYEIYKVKKKSLDGYEMGRYEKTIMYHYTTLSVENVKAREWQRIQCPDKKEIILFKDL